MIGPEVVPPDFDRLLSALCDGVLTPSQMDRLNEFLRSDPGLQRRYISYMGIHAALEYAMGEVTIETGGVPDPSAAPPSRGGWRRCLRRSGLAAAVLLAGLAVASAWWSRPPVAPGSRPPGRIVARVTAGSGMRFDPSGLSAGVDEPVYAGEYRLVEGIVRLTFARGAEVLITAPAEFSPAADDRLVLRRGKLTARVPEPARGFVVEAPSATLIDLGTEFAMDVDPASNGEVHVFRGEVIVRPKSRTDHRPVKLVEAQATRVDAATATPSGIDVRLQPFPPADGRARDGVLPPGPRTDPAVYLNMAPTSDGRSLIEAGSDEGAGRVVVGPDCGTPWVPGRHGSSLQFRGPGSGDHGILPFPPDRVSETLSVVAWVLAESRPRWASILKRWGRPEDHCFHFGLYLDDGDLEVHTAGADGREYFAREGRPLPTGSWQHVAFVADRTTLRLYRNGEEVGRAEHPGLRPGVLPAIGIGAKLNVTADGPDPIEPGFWHGRLDEIAIYPRALEPLEIRRLYKASFTPDAEGSPRDLHSPRSSGPVPADGPDRKEDDIALNSAATRWLLTVRGALRSRVLPVGSAGDSEAVRTRSLSILTRGPRCTSVRIRRASP